MDIPYGRQEITPEDIDAVVNVLKSNFLTQGPTVDLFESRLGEVLGDSFVASVSNGTAALHLSMLALGVCPGQKVIVPSLTFSATANSVRYCGADVIFCDVDPDTLCISVDLVEEIVANDPDVVGIIPVHFAGNVCDMVKISEIAKSHNLWVVEDACHAIGSSYFDEFGETVIVGSGRHSQFTCFSFHPVKHICAGEGGAISSSNSELIDRVKLLRSHGIIKKESEQPTWEQSLVSLGFNYRISDINAALALSQLNRLESNLLRRKELADRYRQELSSSYTFSREREGVRHSYHLFVIQHQGRDELYKYLRDHKIFAQVHYCPVHLMPYYKSLYGKISLENTERYYSRCLSIPMFHAIKEEEVSYVISALNRFVS